MPENGTKQDLLRPVTLSVLDRLLDDEPKSRVEAPHAHGKSLAKLKAAIRRDLENLLNTRCVAKPLPESSALTRSSVYNYGVPGITELSRNFLYDEDRLLAVIENAVRQFEPRIAGVKVSLMPSSGSIRKLRFVIEGVLLVDPAPEQVAFDAALELVSGKYELMGDAAGAR